MSIGSAVFAGLIDAANTQAEINYGTWDMCSKRPHTCGNMRCGLNERVEFFWIGGYFLFE